MKTLWETVRPETTGERWYLAVVTVLYAFAWALLWR
jgi:hypothetical protein